MTDVYLNVAGFVCFSFPRCHRVSQTFSVFSVFLPRVERALRHNRILHDRGCDSDSRLGDGVLLQEVGTG